MRFNSDVEILRYYDYDLYSNRNQITRKEDLDEIVMHHVYDNDLYNYYVNHDGLFDDDFYTRLDKSIKNHIKDSVNKHIHALYLIFFSLLRIKYGHHRELDLRITKTIFTTLSCYCTGDYHDFIPIGYEYKLFKIAKKDIVKYLKIPLNSLLDEIPDDWTIDNFVNEDWYDTYIMSCLNSEKEIETYQLCGIFSWYYDIHWLDKKLPEIKFDF